MNVLLPATAILLTVVVLIVLLEVLRRKAVEKIRASTYNTLLSYYENKVAEFCRDRESGCREKLLDALLEEVATQISANKVNYIDLEELYKRVSNK